MGCVGDRVWASSPQGWAFRDDVHWLYLTNLNAFDLEVRDEHGLLVPDRATYYPSHIHYEGVVRKAMTASASFTFALDNVENPLTEPFEPRKRWTCWSSGRREDWYAIDFGTPRTLTGFDVYFFDDAPTANAGRPESFRVEACPKRPTAWEPVTPIRVAHRAAPAGEERGPVRRPSVPRGSGWCSITRDSGSIPVSMA